MANLKTKDLKHQIIIERPLATIDDEGGFFVEWIKYATRYAKVENLADMRLLKTELFYNGKVNNKNYYQISMRYNTDLNTSYRIRFNNITMNILRIVHDYDNFAVTKLILEENCD